MNLANDGAKYGADQYRFACNYEFRNKSCTIHTSGKKFSLAFAGREKLTFSTEKESETFEYECLKIELATYFIRFGQNAAVIEMSEGLATLVLEEGLVFGSLEIGEQAPGKRHSLTDEMTGTAMCWVLGCDKYVNVVHFDTDECRLAWSPSDDKFVDCSAKCVKIKNGIYLVDIAGSIPDYACVPSGSNRIIMLQDYEHVMLVGCIFGNSPPLMISGYGEFLDFD